MRGLYAASLLVTAAAVRAVQVNYTLNLAHTNVSLDGFSRLALTLNGGTPGPVLVANKGDNMTVLVRNRLNGTHLEHSTSVHWHGIFQPRTAYDDGPAFVTQCPIAPGHDYLYSVVLSDQAGTFWYHSHLGSQYIDGLRGALVVYDRDGDPHRDLYDVDDNSTIISLTDWYHDSAKTLGEAWIAGTGPEPVPDSNLFNGVGRYQGGPKTDRAVITVEAGKRYRFRIINMSAIVPFNFAVEGHFLTVIEADGVSHEPVDVTSVMINAGQRYSVVLGAFNTPRNYWIAYPSNFRVATVPNVTPNYNGTEAFAILHYKNATDGPEVDPPGGLFVPDDTNALQERDLVPLDSPNLPEKADLVIPLNFAPTNPSDDIAAPGAANNWTVNGIQYTSPKLPTLLSILTKDATNQSDFPPDTIVLPYNKTIDVQLIGDSHHPFHLHGHVFQVIQSATGPRNTKNPPIRDTVNTNDQPNATKAVTIRFRTDNPGPWFLHCHKDWHLEAGLAVVFAEDPEDQRNGPKSLHPPKAWKDLCDIYDALPPDDK